MSMTPYVIEILLWHHVSPREFERADAPAFVPTCEQLIEQGLMLRQTAKYVHHKRLYELSEKGKFYIEEGLLKVPLPKAEFIIPWDEAGRKEDGSRN